jgi:tetratricopeptide (TPR) repeat protein
VRLDARLIAAGSDLAMWSSSYERPLGEVLGLDSDVARAVAQAVNVAATPREWGRLAKVIQTNPAAEEAFFQGRVHLSDYGSERARRALEAFQRAARLDPRHAAAHAGAARAYVSLGFNGEISQPEARAFALAEANAALTIDESLADAHAAVADLKFYYDWDWTGAEKEYRRAIELNPSFTYAKRQYASYLAAAGRLDSAVTEASEAARLDPLSAEAALANGLTLYYKRNYSEARDEIRRAIQLEPNHASAWIVLGRVSEAEGRIAEAVDYLEQAHRLTGNPGPALRSHILYLQALSGRHEDVRRQLVDLQREVVTSRARIAPQYFAYLYLALGERDKALDLLTEAVDQREPAVLWLAVDPRVDPLRREPRFTALVQRLGLP